MQTIFRLPWSTEPSSDEALAGHMYAQKPKHKLRVELSPLNTMKRKRTDSLDLSPKNALNVKKLKSENDGAVQPSLEPVKGVDGVSDLVSLKASANGDKTVETASVINGTAQSGGNVVVQLANNPSKEKVLSTPATTTHVLLPPTSENLDTIAGAAHESISTVKQTVMADPRSNVDKLRAIIDAHLNVEILHKHNELRLIEQELAKCQISMEQLRRCELIPYPGATGPVQSVSKGVGKALKSPAGYSSPSSPSPWGVSDGPYSRHYAKWLLPDSQFDAYSLNTGSAVGTPMTTRGIRAHRGAAFDFAMPVPQARTSRTSAGHRQDPSTPASGRDPMIMKRQADNEWVKLKCNVCHRSNFNNIQGFLNHCRIAHHQDYKSHEAAAIACGDVVQVDEATFAVTESAAPTPREPPARAMSMINPVLSSMVVTTPIDQPNANPLLLQSPAHNPLDRVVSLPSTPINVRPKPSLARSSMNSFKGLSPHLSALMQRRGLSTDELPSFIADAKKRVDLTVYDDTDSERDHDAKSKRSKQKKSKGARQSHMAPNGARPQSAKGTTRQGPTFAIAPPPAANFVAQSDFAQTVPSTPSDGDVEMDLSPGTAPGLVSDHEDDDDDAEDEAKSANGSQHEAEDVEIRDASDVEREERKSVRVVPGSEEAGRVCRQQGTGMC